MIQRLLIAAAILVAIQGAVLFIRQHREPSSIREPAMKIADLPLRMAGWTGKDAPIDPRLSAAIRALSVVDRIYRDDSKATLVLELAAFAGNEIELPHMPQSCYTNVGFTMKQQKDVQLKRSDGPPRQARILGFEQENQRIHVLYWYQLGDASVLDYNGLRRERSRLFGEKTWPPLIKVMIQSSLADPVQAEDQLVSFAESVLSWTRRL